MATVTRENIGLLTDKLTVTISKEDYYPEFEKNLKTYSKKANIPGFRQGMVPLGMVKKMYGQSLFAEEVIRNIEKGLNEYLSNERLEIFAQPLPLSNKDFKPQMDQPQNYEFEFEIGLKPSFDIKLDKLKAPYYKVNVTSEMINEEVERLRQRLGKLTEPETASQDENVLNVTFEETDSEGNVLENGHKKDNSLLVKYFSESFRPKLIGMKKGDSIRLTLEEAFDEKERDWVRKDLGLSDGTEELHIPFLLNITKVGLVEKRELNEEFFKEALPGKDITNEKDFLTAVENDIQSYWNRQSSNQLQHHLYHVLLEDTHMELPEAFLKRWLSTAGEKPKTAEEAESEYPSFEKQLRWTLITDKIVNAHNIEVSPEELKGSFRQQILGYFGGMSLGDGNLEWIDQYVETLMKDEQQVDGTYRKLLTEKVFQWAEEQVQKDEKAISSEEFIKMNEEHQHTHH